jgi:hypothetical protein
MTSRTRWRGDRTNLAACEHIFGSAWTILENRIRIQETAGKRLSASDAEPLVGL